MSDDVAGATRPSAMATGIVEWAARAPDRTGFVDPQRAVTLAEIDARAAALAARLLDGAVPPSAGASPWLPVMVDRAVTAAIALHGVVRAGLAFAPIDASAPRELVAELFARLGHPTSAVVTDPTHAALLPEAVQAIPALGDTVDAAPPRTVDMRAPGLVLFTSGTTGRPKGVVLPWSSLDDRVDTALSFGPDAGDAAWREAFVQPFGFSPALRALIVPSVGRTLCIADPRAMTVDELLDWLDRQQVDSVSFPPSLARAIVRVAAGRPRLPSVSILRSGAEASGWELVAPLRRLVGRHVTIVAGYSASEAGRIARFEIAPDHPLGQGRIPLGPLLPGVEVRLDAVDGDASVTELRVARPQSLGYLGDPELTARRFVTDPDGVRWWRSGDVVRTDADGVYHFLGRVDEMVKINGVFVAPSRVEEALQAVDGIAAAAVLPHRTSTRPIRLVAHVQLDDDALEPETVTARLRERLPRELVPSILVRHDDLPRTDRQKLDRRALEGAPLVRWRSSPAREPAPKFEWWCVHEVRGLIGLDDVGPDDDLFEAGLDSVAALELCAAIADAGFGELDPSLLLEARTVAGIRARLHETFEPGPSTAVALNADGTDTTLFVLPGGGSTALKFRFLAKALGADRPVVVIEPRGMHRPGAADRTIDGLAAHALEEIEARLGPDDPCLLLGYSASAVVAYDVAQRLHAAGRPVHLVLLDGAPVREAKRDGAGTAGAVGRPATVRTATAKELPAAAMRSMRFRRTRLRRWWFGRRPGAPSFDVDRYVAFMRILGKAGRSYEPAPAAFPATLIHVSDDDLVRRCARLVPDLSVHKVGGDHLTMLEPPEVANLAALIAEITDTAFTPASRPSGNGSTILER